MRTPSIFITTSVLLATALAAPAALTLRQMELATRPVVSNAMARVAAYQVKAYGGPAPTDWRSGTFYSGVLAAHLATGNPDFLRYATEWSESAHWKIPKNPLHADQICTAQTYLDLFMLRRDAAMLADTKAQLELMFNRTKLKRTDLGHAIWNDAERDFTGRNLWWWCDALYMAPPVLARMSAATGDTRYRELLHTLYWDSVAFLYDKEDHLFYRDESQFRAKTPSGKKVFWARGNGWVYGGLIRTLDYLPADDPQRVKYVELFREMTRSLVRYQQPDGLWRCSLNDPGWYPSPETSGTSFFCYGFLAGINRGYLDKRSYLPLALHAWEGLLNCVNADGRLGYSQLVAGSPGPVRPDNAIDYAHGAFLLAASELYKMNLTAEELHRLEPPYDVARLHEHGAWTWYNDERAIVAKEHLLVGSLDARTGEAKLATLNLRAVHSGLSWSEQVLSSWRSLDDHNNPALLELDNGNILAIYSKHHVHTNWNWRIATPAQRGPLVEFKWGPEQTYSYQARSTYANIAQLADEKGRIYNFFRGINFNPTLATSDDNAKTWSSPIHLIRVDGQRPYVKYASNGKNRIDLLFTDGHPRNVATNNIYHLYYQTGNLYRTDGTLIRSLAEVANGHPIEPFEATKIYDGNTAGRGWVWDIEYARNGDPVAAYINSADGDGGNDLRYRYARWDSAAKQWREQQIAYAGQHLYMPENHYAGGISIDPNDENTVYISTAVEPDNGNPNATGRRQIYRGKTSDLGKTWAWEQLTFDAASDNLRPFVPRQHSVGTCVLWFQGHYQTFLNYDTDIVGIITDRPANPLR